MLQLQELYGKHQIHHDGQYIGSLQFYDNPCHMKNCYVKLVMEDLDTCISAELFCKVQKIAGRPLQVMVGSDDVAMIEFLTAGGFLCKRKCYEIEAGAEDYIGGTADVKLNYCSAGDVNYEQCCRMMYHYYVDTHKAINPWTAGFTAFCDELPGAVVYAKIEDSIVSLAFVEDNEIAYVCGTDKQLFEGFARCLAATVLAKHETICFESDDCDWAAMMLKSMFINQDETSYDTYVMGDMIQLQSVNDDMHNGFYKKLNYQNCNNLVLKSKWL